jgi:hypothetical protein
MIRVLAATLFSVSLMCLVGGPMMADAADVVLREDIDQEQAVATLDLYSEEKSLGTEGPLLQRITESQITIGLHEVEVVSSQPDQGTTSWDYYSVYQPFTLHRLTGERYYESAVFQVTIDNPSVTAADLFPKNVIMELKIERRVSITPQLKFSYKIVEASAGGEVGTSISYVSLLPVITSYGEGERQFYWEYKAHQEQSVLPGTKQAAVVLRVPHGLNRITATVEYAAVVVETMLGGLYRKKDTKTGEYVVTWRLPNPPRRTN